MKNAKSGTVSATDPKPPPRLRLLRSASDRQSRQKLPELIANRSVLWHSLGHDAEWDRRIASALNAVRAESRSGTRAPGEIRDLRGLLDQMRLIKDAHEIELMRRAADIASAGHARAMRACRPGMAEYELEAELSYEFRRRGADGHAYTPIVAGGANACILHYVENNKLLAGQSLVLIDAGCELAGYASDITRTFPVSGRFSAGATRGLRNRPRRAAGGDCRSASRRLVHGLSPGSPARPVRKA
jgi:Xaa-Pro aminopeptidase